MKKEDVQLLKYKIATKLSEMNNEEKMKVFEYFGKLNESNMNNRKLLKCYLDYLGIDYNWTDLQNEKIIKESYFNWDRNII